MEKTVEVGEEYQGPSFRCIRFKMPLRHPIGTVCLLFAYSIVWHPGKR